MTKNLIILLPMLIALNSCAEMNSKFDCPQKMGAKCASLDQVNAEVDRGELGNTPCLSCGKSDNTVYKQQSNETESSSSQPARIHEAVMHIWVSPFEDTSGNYHLASDIYTVAQPGSWSGNPIAAINDDEE